jgi:hypothetical protein
VEIWRKGFPVLITHVDLQIWSKQYIYRSNNNTICLSGIRVQPQRLRARFNITNFHRADMTFPDSKDTCRYMYVKFPSTVTNVHGYLWYTIPNTDSGIRHHISLRYWPRWIYMANRIIQGLFWHHDHTHIVTHSRNWCRVIVTNTTNTTVAIWIALVRTYH